MREREREKGGENLQESLQSGHRARSLLSLSPSGAAVRYFRREPVTLFIDVKRLHTRSTLYDLYVSIVETDLFARGEARSEGKFYRRPSSQLPERPNKIQWPAPLKQRFLRRKIGSPETI